MAKKSAKKAKAKKGRAKKPTAKAKANARGSFNKALTIKGSFRKAIALHRLEFTGRTIKGTQIAGRIISAFGLRPPVNSSEKISDLLGGDANAWDLALMLMAYVAFKNDGLDLQKSDVMKATTLGQLGDLVFAWYDSNNWTIT